MLLMSRSRVPGSRASTPRVDWGTLRCVTVVDCCNHHVFQPLRCELATAALPGLDISATIRSAVRRQMNTSVLLAKICEIDVQAKRLQLDSGPLDYDYLRHRGAALLLRRR